jgi:transcription elongation factor GreA
MATAAHATVRILRCTELSMPSRPPESGRSAYSTRGRSPGAQRERGNSMAEPKEKKAVLTKEGYRKLEAELNHYISVRRNEIAEQIATARGFGDLSENAEYDEAKNEQSRIEAKIVEMENTLRNCVVIEDDDVNTETVGVGNAVKVLNQTLKKEQVFTIVGANETNPKEMKISSESPIGATLLGKKVGQVVPVETPSGVMKLKVLEISR